MWNAIMRGTGVSESYSCNEWMSLVIQLGDTTVKRCVTMIGIDLRAGNLDQREGGPSVPSSGELSPPSVRELSWTRACRRMLL